EGALDAARELLGMELSYSTRHDGDQQLIEHATGGHEGFALAPGLAFPLELTLCRRILAGELPSIMPDVLEEPAARDMPVVQAIGLRAYCSVPLTFSDGTVHGTLCCASQSPRAGLGERDLHFLTVLARLVADQIERDLRAEAHVQALVESASVQALMAAVEARDGYTGEHSQAVEEHAIAVAERLGLTPGEVSEVRIAAALHDVGKLAVPDAILHKPAPLTFEEWAVMREHPLTGARIVEALPGLASLAPIVRAEHERWDGTGYPHGLAGCEIPLAARIVFVCDAYHAMTSDRPYRRAMGHDAAVEEIARQSARQFCPRASAALLEVLGASVSAAA
ncbi:MAG TPA: HD-GYP domain-containing protein, partial [Capillimicrobium sp.]